MRWRVSVDGVATTLKAFLSVEKGVIDLRQLGAWKAVASVFYKIEKRLFETEGSSGEHGKWAPVTIPYGRQKFRKWKSVRILRASDALYRSLTSRSGPDSVFEEQAQEMSIGTSLLYPKYHQTGTSKMAARRPIDLTAEDEKQINDVLKQKVRQLIQNARLKDTRGF